MIHTEEPVDVITVEAVEEIDGMKTYRRVEKKSSPAFADFLLQKPGSSVFLMLFRGEAAGRQSSSFSSSSGGRISRIWVAWRFSTAIT